MEDHNTNLMITHNISLQYRKWKLTMITDTVYLQRYPSWEDRIYQVQMIKNYNITSLVENVICDLVAASFVFQVASDGLKAKDIVLGAQIDLR